MQLNTLFQDDTQIVSVDAMRIDAASAIQFKDAMRVTTATDARRVVLDLSQVKFVDSSGLGAIVASMKQMGEGRQLDLASLSPDVEKVFQLTRMDSIFNIHSSVNQAVLGKAG